MELEKYIVTYEWQNHSLVSNKCVSHNLCRLHYIKSFQILKTTKMKFEKLLGWQVIRAIHFKFFKFVYPCLHLYGGSVAEQLEQWTCNPESPSLSHTLTASWICSR